MVAAIGLTLVIILACVAGALVDCLVHPGVPGIYVQINPEAEVLLKAA